MRFLNNRLVALLSTTILTSTLVSGNTAPAIAQSTDVQLDEITVTARKRPERVWDIPFSVDVQAQPQLDEKRVTDAPSALRDVGGASIGTFGDKSNSFIIMQGVAPILTPLSPDDSSVLTFVDGAPLPMGASNSSYLDLQRVEVLKGPQSTLFGRNTSGGAINLIPALPTFTPEGYVRGEYGTGNFHRLEGVVSGPIVPGKVAGRFAFRRNGADGYIDNVFGPTLGSDASWSGRASLLFTPTDRTTWTVSASMEDSRARPVYYLLSPGPRLAGQDRAVDDSKIGNFISKFEHSLDTFTFTSQTSYATFKNRNEYTYGDAFLMSGVFGGMFPPAFFSDPAQNFNVWDRKERRFTQEIRFTSAPNARVPWLLGAAYYQDKADYQNASDMFGLVFGDASRSGSRTYNLNTQGQAVFGEVTFPIMEKLKWSIGARATHEHKKFEGQYFGGAFTAVGAVPYFYEDGSRSYSFWTGRTGLTYEWTDQFMSFANVSRGYKSGGFGTFNTQQYLGIPREPYDSATVMTYEVGGRASLLDNRLRINAALFFNDVKDEQILSYDPLTFAAVSLNIDTQSRGFEIDAAYQIAPHWEVSAGVAYTNAKLLNVSAEVMATQPGVKDGNRLPNVPEWTAKGAVGYRAPASEWGLGGPLADSHVVGRVGYNYIGERYTDAGNFGLLDPVHLVSARLGIDWGRGEAYIFGENLLDKKYMTVNQYFTLPPTVFGASYARGAVVGLGTSVRF
jgi:iron complex outermembrane receptor protein